MYDKQAEEASTPRRKTFDSLSGQRLALVGPLERFGHRAIVVVDEGQNLRLQVLYAGEGTALEDLAHQDREPDFDLVHSGTVFGGVMEHHLVGRVTQESRPAFHGLKDAALAFDAQVLFDPGQFSHPAH
jgi:hypothetical protein